MVDERFLEEGLAQMRAFTPLDPTAVAAVKALVPTGTHDHRQRL